jgi:hypothetical protein
MNAEELLEYDKLKGEQLARITARDNLINYNLIALGALATVAITARASTEVLLLAPLISAILGWAYVQHEQKITAIGRYIRRAYPSAFGWEREDKHLVLTKTFHSVVSLITILLAFSLPCIACPFAWLILTDVYSAWSFAVALLDILLGLCIAMVVIVSLSR